MCYNGCCCQRCHHHHQPRLLGLSAASDQHTHLLLPDADAPHMVAAEVLCPTCSFGVMCLLLLLLLRPGHQASLHLTERPAGQHTLHILHWVLLLLLLLSSQPLPHHDQQRCCWQRLQAAL